MEWPVTHIDPTSEHAGIYYFRIQERVMMKCIFNDQILDHSKVNLPINDLAVMRGYGVFDFFRLSAGVPLFMDEHLDRFYGGATYAALRMPINKNALTQLLYRMFDLNKMSVSGVRLILTGGTGNGSYATGKSNLIITQEPIAFPTKEMFADGVKLITYEYLRDLPGIKTINYMTGIWLQSRVRENKAFDALYTHNGFVHELTRSNIFIVTRKGIIATPREQILNGITRSQLVKTVSNIQQRPISIEDLSTAREVFITGTSKKVLPVHTINNWQYSSASSGSRTRNIMDLFCEIETSYIKDRLEKI